MTIDQYDNLDPEELMFLGLEASERGERALAMSLYKRSIALGKSAKAIFLLAMEYAELMMYDRAIEGVEEAIRLAPEYSGPHYTLSLLLYNQGRYEEAREALRPLIALASESNYYYQYGVALEAILDNDLHKARKHLELGIANNDQNPAVARTMAGMLEQLDEYLAATDEAKSTLANRPPKEDLDEKIRQQIDLAKYRQFMGGDNPS
jgi:tetratricopeptide (TPR) repeat protein